MHDVELVGVVDINAARAMEIAAKYGGEPFTSVSETVGRVDAVTIAVPTTAHVEVAMPFIERGVAVLIEKPIAPSVADADRLLDAASRHNVVCAAGHTERFNPAVAAAL